MLMKQRDFDFLAGMPKASFDRLRKLIIELVSRGWAERVCATVAPVPSAETAQAEVPGGKE